MARMFDIINPMEVQSYIDDRWKASDARDAEADVRGILSRYYTPAGEDDVQTSVGVGRVPRAAAFDAEGAISELASRGHMTQAKSLADLYSIGRETQEKFGTGGDLIETPAGLVKRLYSDRAGYKDIPLGGSRYEVPMKISTGTEEILVKPSAPQAPIASYKVEPSPDIKAREGVTIREEGRKPKVAAAVTEATTIAEAKAKETAGAESASATYDKTIGIIDSLINHKGRKSATGADYLRSRIPGTDAADYAAILEQLQGQNFLAEIQRMKGQGSLSDAEGKKLSSAAAALSQSRTEEGHLEALKQLRREIESIKRRRSMPAASDKAAAFADYKSARAAAVKQGRTDKVKQMDAEARKDGLIK